MYKFVAATSLLAVAGAAHAQSLSQDVTIFNFQDAEVTREFAFMADGPRNNALDINGRDFTQATTAFNADGTSGQFQDDFPDDFVFGSAGQDAGVHLITGAGTSLSATATPVGGGLVEVAVIQTTDDSSDIIPSGSAPDGSPLDLLVFEMGEGNAASEFTAVPIPLTNGNGDNFKVVDAQYVLFIDGAMVANFPIMDEVGTLPSLDDQVAVSEADGAGIDGHGMVWTIQIPTPGAAALFGVAGLAAVRRRRA